MKRTELFLLLITSFNDYIKEVKYNRFISPFWTIVFLKDGVSLHLEIRDDKIIPYVNHKTHSILEYDEVFPFIVGAFNLHHNIQNAVNSHLCKVH